MPDSIKYYKHFIDADFTVVGWVFTVSTFTDSSGKVLAVRGPTPVANVDAEIQKAEYDALVISLKAAHDAINTTMQNVTQRSKTTPMPSQIKTELDGAKGKDPQSVTSSERDAFVEYLIWKDHLDTNGKVDFTGLDQH